MKLENIVFNYFNQDNNFYGENFGVIDPISIIIQIPKKEL